MDLLLSHPFVGIALAALVGLQCGSFLNVVVWRLPLMMQRQWQADCEQVHSHEVKSETDFNLWTPASHCPACQAPLRPAHLVPVLSYLWLKGQCGFCRAPVSVRYPLVEIAVALIWGLCASHWGLSLEALAWAGFGSTLLTLALIDLDTMLLPDSLTLSLLWGGILCASLGLIKVSLIHSVWGAALGYGILWLVQTVFKLITGKQGMGEGDYKLLAALGAWLGWMALPMVLLLASLSGVLIAVLLRWRGRLQVDQPLPFGPYLAMAGMVCAVLDLHSSLFYF